MRIVLFISFLATKTIYGKLLSAFHEAFFPLSTLWNLYPFKVRASIGSIVMPLKNLSGSPFICGCCGSEKAGGWNISLI
jgi:hypothetical protein